MRRFLLFLPVVIFAALAVAFATPILRQSDPSALPYARMDAPAPRLELEALHADGLGFDADTLGGQVAMVNVFASWCAPCLVEHPILTRLAEEDGIPLYGIAYRDDPEATRAWLQRHGDVYDRIGVDADGRAGIEWGIHGVPETFVIDREGRIRYRFAGAVTAEIARDEIIPLVRALQQGPVETEVSGGAAPDNAGSDDTGAGGA